MKTTPVKPIERHIVSIWRDSVGTLQAKTSRQNQPKIVLTKDEYEKRKAQSVVKANTTHKIN
ncbi:MAG: hypothetical protein K6A44_03530 [bacterium]|nr:hypothetical protein [bacterium]